jgi:hypothetical protein
VGEEREGEKEKKVLDRKRERGSGKKGPFVPRHSFRFRFYSSTVSE